jgi:hypothetical protein
LVSPHLFPLLAMGFHVVSWMSLKQQQPLRIELDVLDQQLAECVVHIGQIKQKWTKLFEFISVNCVPAGMDWPAWISIAL